MERHGGFGGFGGSIDCTDEEGQERVFAQGDALPALAHFSADANLAASRLAWQQGDAFSEQQEASSLTMTNTHHTQRAVNVLRSPSLLKSNACVGGSDIGMALAFPLPP